MLGTAHHYGITVSDLDESIAFYRDVFGMDLLDRFSMDAEAFSELLGSTTTGAEVAFLDAGGFRLELEEHANANVNVPASTEPVDVGVPHLCLAVDDIQAVYETHEDIDFVSAPGSASDSGATIVYLRDPDGNLVELIESPSA